MKISRAMILAAGLLLVGAGCQQPSPTPPPQTPVSDGYSTTPAPTPAPTDTTDGSTPPSDTATPDKPPTMDKQWAFPGVLPDNQISNREIRIKTDKGDIVFQLFEKEAPKTVSNFIYLAKGGFYDGLTFHRRESWVLQGGDPNGNGTGGPGYRFEDEKVTRAYKRGVVAMANAGPNTNGSQFFILTQDTPLDPAYTIFGEVTSGMEVVDQMQVGSVMRSVMVEAKGATGA